MAHLLTERAPQIPRQSIVRRSKHGPAFHDECNRIGKELGLPPVRTAKARGPEKSLPSCAHWPFNVRPEGYYRGALDIEPELVKEGEAAEADEDASTERPAAEPEHLAKFLPTAIEQFEQRFTITPEEASSPSPGREGARAEEITGPGWQDHRPIRALSSKPLARQVLGPLAGLASRRLFLVA